MATLIWGARGKQISGGREVNELFDIEFDEVMIHTTPENPVALNSAKLQLKRWH
jgi:hypothetical protein